MDNVMVFDHPLIQHKISILRNKATGTNEFRALIEEIAMLMGYEALRDLPLEDVEVETPIETCMTPMIAGRKLAVVPILRAGLGMVNGILALVPSAKVGHIGLYRDEVTHEPHEYYCKLPNPIEERTIIVTDPMLAVAFREKPKSFSHKLQKSTTFCKLAKNKRAFERYFISYQTPFYLFIIMAHPVCIPVYLKYHNSMPYKFGQDDSG